MGNDSGNQGSWLRAYQRSGVIYSLPIVSSSLLYYSHLRSSPFFVVLYVPSHVTLAIPYILMGLRRRQQRCVGPEGCKGREAKKGRECWQEAAGLVSAGRSFSVFT
jgi:hypothetical protein